MPPIPADTDPSAAEVMDELYARMSPARKLARVRDLTLMANRVALEGLRARHPDETERELLLRLARVRLGSDVVDRIYPAEGGGDDA